MLWLAALAAPVVVVQAVGLLGSAGPAAAGASTPSLLEPLPAPIVPSVPLNPAQKAAAKWLAAQSDLAPTQNRSPLTPGQPPITPPVPVTVLPERTNVPALPRAQAAPRVSETERPLEHLTLSAIMRAGIRSVAIINNRNVRLGEEALPGWTLVGIDARNRIVYLKNRYGRIEALESADAFETR